MKLEVPIKFGSTTHNADIVVEDLLCEVKSPKSDSTKALRQAIDYSLKLPEIRFILVTNGREFEWHKKQAGEWIKYNP